MIAPWTENDFESLHEEKKLKLVIFFSECCPDSEPRDATGKIVTSSVALFKVATSILEEVLPSTPPNPTFRTKRTAIMNVIKPPKQPNSKGKPAAASNVSKP